MSNKHLDVQNKSKLFTRLKKIDTYILEIRMNTKHYVITLLHCEIQIKLYYSFIKNKIKKK